MANYAETHCISCNEENQWGELQPKLRPDGKVKHKVRSTECNRVLQDDITTVVSASHLNSRGVNYCHNLQWPITNRRYLPIPGVIVPYNSDV
jgi:hypothetical protein